MRKCNWLHHIWKFEEEKMQYRQKWSVCHLQYLGLHISSGPLGLSRQPASQRLYFIRRAAQTATATAASLHWRTFISRCRTRAMSRTVYQTQPSQRPVHPLTFRQKAAQPPSPDNKVEVQLLAWGAEDHKLCTINRPLHLTIATCNCDVTPTCRCLTVCFIYYTSLSFYYWFLGYLKSLYYHNEPEKHCSFFVVLTCRMTNKESESDSGQWLSKIWDQRKVSVWEEDILNKAHITPTIL